MNYRSIQENDFSALSQILFQLGYEVSASSIAERVNLIYQMGGDIFVAENEDEIIGCVQALIDVRLAEGRVGEIVSLVVLEIYRGKGIGKDLVRRAEEFLLSSNCQTIRIRANKKRVKAHQFYQSQGYKEKKEQKVFLRIGEE